MQNLVLFVPRKTLFKLSDFCNLAGHILSVFLYVQNSKNVISAMPTSKEILFVLNECSGNLCKRLSQLCALRRGRLVTIPSKILTTYNKLLRYRKPYLHGSN